MAVLEGVGASVRATRESTLTGAHGADALGGGRTPCTTSTTVVIVLSQIIAIVTALGELLGGAGALGIDALRTLTTGITAVTTVIDIIEHVDALTIATELAKGADTTVTTARGSGRTLVEAFTTMLIVALERNTGLLSITMTAEVLVVGAHTLAILAYTGITTLTITGTTVLTILLGINTLATTGGLALQTLTGTTLAVLVSGTGVGTRTAVVAIGEDGDALIRTRATDTTSLALNTDASAVDTRGEARALETTDTTVVRVGPQVSVTTTTL